MAKERKAGGAKRKLLEAARELMDALQAGGLSATVIDRYENALKVIDSQGKKPGAAVEVLVHDLRREVGEIQAAVKKEFPGNASFQAVFKAQEPMPSSPREVLALSRLMRRVLYEVLPDDPLTFVSVAAVLIVAAGLASYLPARRAARVDPSVVLRYD